MSMINHELKSARSLDYPKTINKTVFFIIIFNLLFSFVLLNCASNENNSNQNQDQNSFQEPNSSSNSYDPTGDNFENIEWTTNSSEQENSISNNQHTTNQQNSSANSTNPENNIPEPDNNNSSPGYDCFEITSEAESVRLPVDIIWVIDTSGSMGDEVDLINQRMNSFATFIGNSGIDYHVIVIADGDGNDWHSSTYDICVGPPLSGSEQCPDTNGDYYRRVRHHVDSHNGLEVILDTYPDYKNFLRLDSMVHFIAVSDDESFMSSDQFRQRLAALENPSLDNRWTFHSIVSDYYTNFWGMEKGCSGPYGEAVIHGEQYIELSDYTDGIFSEICTADWDSIFQTIGENVLTSNAMPCAYEIPQTPEGLTVDYSQIDVDMTLIEEGQEVELQLEQVITEAECNGGNTWYFDNNDSPSLIFLCPTACGFEINGQIRINFKCIKG